MNSPDHDTIIRAVEDARRILGEYRGDAKRTVERLLAVLDRSDVVHALDRIKRRKVIRLVECYKGLKHIASGPRMILDILTVLFFVLGSRLFCGWLGNDGDVLHGPYVTKSGMAPGDVSDDRIDRMATRKQPSSVTPSISNVA